MALIQELTDKIARLEAQHKGSRAVEVAVELAETRSRLQEELYKKARKRMMLSQKLFYEHGNKPGRLISEVHAETCTCLHYSSRER